MTDDQRWRTEARRLATELTSRGLLVDGWRKAFEDVPRGDFIPYYFRSDDTIVNRADAADFTEWISAVYSDQSLVTQLRPIPGTDALRPTSSSTMPSLMARMLGLLDVNENSRVLEIGTGTGYNAALLCHRLGSDQVASVDIDPTLVDQAAKRLHNLDMSPALIARDGAEGFVEQAPYDRIIATCAVPSVPVAWIQQLTPGGSILADVRGEFASALVLLAAGVTGTVQGRFLPVAGNFMWLRGNVGSPLRTDGATAGTEFRTDGDQRPSVVQSETFNDPDFRFFANLAVPGVSSVSRLRSDRRNLTYIRSDDQSWAAIIPSDTDEIGNIVQGGGRQIWDEIEHAAHHWSQIGKPDRSRFGLTIHTNGRHDVWLDSSSHIELSLQPDQGDGDPDRATPASTRHE